MGWDNNPSIVASSVAVLPGDPAGIDTSAAGELSIGGVNATSINIDPPTTIDNTLALTGGFAFGGVGVANGTSINGPSPTWSFLSGGVTVATLNSSPFINFPGDVQMGAHLLSTSAGTPTTSTLGANVTSATFTGNDTRGTIAIVMAGALAANTRAFTATFALTYGATAPKVTLVDQTSAVGLTIVNSYVLAQATGVSFDVAFDQALGAGTYIIDYIVIG